MTVERYDPHDPGAYDLTVVLAEAVTEALADRVAADVEEARIPGVARVYAEPTFLFVEARRDLPVDPGAVADATRAALARRLAA